MSARKLAWPVWGACLALTGVGLGFLALNGGFQHANSIGSPALDAIVGVLLLTFPTVGLAIAVREPRNAIGWLFLGAGVGASLEDALLGYATYTLVTAPGTLPGGAMAALVADAVWLPVMASATLLLFVLFPTGRPLSPRWRWFVWFVALDVAVYGVATLLNPEPLYFFPALSSPIGLEWTGTTLQTVLDVASPLMFACLGIGMVALALRFRRSAGIERRQIAWLVYAGSVWVACMPGLIWLGDQGDWRVGGVLVADLMFSLLIATIPLAVGIAILMHRLYDIDVVVKRTLVYGALTATLLGTYLGSVLVFRFVLSPVTGDSDLAVAASTLAVAALFRPARARIQAGVDRRFYRARYDTARTLETFSGRLRDELDLDALGTNLRTVVADTMQPTHVSLWLRRAVR